MSVLAIAGMGPLGFFGGKVMSDDLVSVATND